MLTPRLIISFLLFSGVATAQPKVENYDLRGQGFSQAEVRETAQLHSQNKLVLICHVNKNEFFYQDLIMRLVAENMLEDRKRIMVLFVEKGPGKNATYLFALGKLRDGVIGNGSDYGVTLNQAIEEVYDLYFN